MGPKTVSRLRTTASGAPTVRSRGMEGDTVVVVVTLPSFAGRSSVGRAAQISRGCGCGARFGPRGGRGHGCRRGDEQAAPRKPALAPAWQGRSIRGSDRTPLGLADGRSVEVVENRTEGREFLATRRAKITPEQAGIPFYGQRRRVPGLRREEVAQLSGLSVDYYVRLEKGNLRGASDSVLEAIARALQLDDAERAHLFDLAHAARSGGRQPRRRRAAPEIRPGIQHMLDAMTVSVAFVRNGRLDICAINPLGRAFYRPIYDAEAAYTAERRPPNLPRFCFLAPTAEEFYPDWNEAADTTVAILRTEAGRDPHNRALTDLVGELATRSDAFRTRWAADDVRLHHTGIKRFRHPVVGDLTVGFNAMELPADPGLTLTMYTAEPGSPSEEKLTLIASWSATADETQADTAADRV